MADLLHDALGVVNVGLEIFADSVTQAGVPLAQIDWRPPGDGDPKLAWVLARLAGDAKLRVTSTKSRPPAVCMGAIAVNCLTGLPFRMLRAVLRPRPPGPGLQVTWIVPSQPLGSLCDAICWSRPNIERWIALGERDGKNALSSITM